MRVTAATKVETRQRILEAAQKLFAADGFATSTTRDIAETAGIATGTLFNYFPTKEAVLESLAAEAIACVDREFEGGTEDTFEEDLFAYVATGLRKLKPLRKHIPVLLETTLNPLVTATIDAGQSLRVGHLEMVFRLAKMHSLRELSPLALQLYWTLYIGVLMFWAHDHSSKQEDTLALLDSSLDMFVGWLQRENNDSKLNRQGVPNYAPIGN